MEIMKLSDIATISAGQSAPQGDECYTNDGIPFVKAGNLSELIEHNDENQIQKVSEKTIFEYKLKLYPKRTILFAKSGMSCMKGLVYVLKQDCYVVSHLACITPLNIESDYLKYYFEYHKPNTLVKDESYPSISLKDIGDMTIKVFNAEKRKKIIENLNKLNLLINKNKSLLKKYDELVKSQFIEMFGDPETNSKNIQTQPMTEVCSIIDGDRGKNYPTQEEFFDKGYCLFLNAKNVTSTGFDFSNCMFITKEKDELLRNGKLSRGDVVLTTRGTLGNLAYYTNDVPFENVRINSGMVILRMDTSKMSKIFFIEQFKMQLDLIKKRIASGSAQPQLPISTMNKISILTPSIELQNQFADFVKHIDKLKFRKNITKLENICYNIFSFEKFNKQREVKNG